MNQKDANTKELSAEWTDAFSTIHPYYLYNDAIKIDRKMYDGINGKEGIAFIGKTDDF